MGNMDQPEDQQFHAHNGLHVPLVTICVKDPDFLGEEEQRYHQHSGQDVPVMVVFAKRLDCPNAMEEMGVLCPVCEFCPNPALEADQLALVMGMYHFEDGD